MPSTQLIVPPKLGAIIYQTNWRFCTVPSGYVKFWIPEKNFGFIVQDNSTKEVFVGARDVERAGLKDLRENQRLSFEIEMRNKGPAAVELKALS
jgi:cold shock protein